MVDCMKRCRNVPFDTSISIEHLSDGHKGSFYGICQISKHLGDELEEQLIVDGAFENSDKWVSSGWEILLLT